MSTRTAEVEIPEEVKLRVEQDTIKVKGPLAELSRKIPGKHLRIEIKGNRLEILPKDKSSFTRALVGTYRSHIKNMIAGVQKPYVYKLKIAFTHFPITVSLSGSELSVQNFLGEKKPRKVKLPEGVKVTVEGNIITVESPDIELAGKSATLIEQATTIRGRDRRIFQDGIYLIEKGKK